MEPLYACDEDTYVGKTAFVDLLTTKNPVFWLPLFVSVYSLLSRAIPTYHNFVGDNIQTCGSAQLVTRLYLHQRQRNFQISFFLLESVSVICRNIYEQIHGDMSLSWSLWCFPLENCT